MFTQSSPASCASTEVCSDADSRRNQQTRRQKENNMRHFPFSQSHPAMTRLCFAAMLTALVAGCVTDDPGALERAQLQNLTSETALNAQIISDRARAQRCDRDPSRREC
jgi:hypothetical protein